MSLDVDLPADVAVVALDAPDEILVVVEGSDVVEVVVGPGEGDATVEVDAGVDAEIEVQAGTSGEIEVVEQDSLPDVDHVIEIIAGPPGPAGPQGPPGAGALEQVAYTHVQALPAEQWVIDHPLPFYPAVTVVDSAGTAVEGDVQYPSAGVVVLTFAAGFSGAAHLS